MTIQRNLILAILVFLTVAGNLFALTIEKNSQWQIVLPDKSADPEIAKHLRKCAEVLQKALSETLNVKGDIVPEAEKKSDSKAIYLGNTEKLRQIGVDVQKYPDFSFTIREHDGNIFIAGEDKQRYGQKSGRANNIFDYIMGTFKGCIVFAEKFLDTRFLLPGEYGIDYSSTLERAVIPENLKMEISPNLLFAAGRPCEAIYAYSNNNYGFGGLKSYGGHSYYSAVPKKLYAKSHPEYFALIEGARDSNENHLCISNSDVQELMYKEMLKQIDAGAEIVQLAQTDGYIPCGCDKCKAFGNTDDPGEKVWILHRSLAERLLKDRPEKKVQILAYYPNRMPPVTFKEFPPNVIIELSSYGPAEFEEWSKVKVPGGFSVYLYNWGHYKVSGMTPKRTPQFCAEQIKLFLKYQVRGIYRCGFGENFGLEGPSYYVFGKMLDDSEQNYEKVLDDYYHRTFREAYTPMRSFFDTYYNRLAIYSRLDGRNSSGNPIDRLEVTPKDPRVLITAIYSPGLLEVLENLLARAEKTAEDPKVKMRLKLVRFDFDYAKNLSEILHFYNAYRLRPDKAGFERLAEKIDWRNALIEESFRDGKNQPVVPGWPDILRFSEAQVPVNRSSVQVNGRLTAPIGAPLSWNTKILREKNILPGTQKKVVEAVKAQGIVAETEFTAGAWAKADFQELSGIQLGPIRSATRFKVIYDDRNIYFGLISDLPADRRHTSCGRDGRCFYQDALELFIDPTAGREIYYHFIINPIENSWYDSAFGLITDPLNPLYNNCDVRWNGNWSYRNTRIGDKWHALITIPFSDFKVPPPTAGTTWLLNVGREDRVIVKQHSNDLELSLWSPNLETMSFHDREAFGTLYFK